MKILTFLILVLLEISFKSNLGEKMFNKTHKEIDKFTLGIQTVKSHESLLEYAKSDIYSSIKLLISISSTFSIYWKVILPFIVSISILLLLSIIKPIAEQINTLLNTNYILAIWFCLVVFSFIYILNCKKYLIVGIEKSKGLLEKR